MRAPATKCTSASMRSRPRALVAPARTCQEQQPNRWQKEDVNRQVMAPAVNTCIGHRRVGQSAPTSDAASFAYRCSMPLSPSLPYASTLLAWPIFFKSVFPAWLDACSGGAHTTCRCPRHQTCPPALSGPPQHSPSRTPCIWLLTERKPGPHAPLGAQDLLQPARACLRQKLRILRS